MGSRLERRDEQSLGAGIFARGGVAPDAPERPPDDSAEHPCTRSERLCGEPAFAPVAIRELVGGQGPAHGLVVGDQPLLLGIERPERQLRRRRGLGPRPLGAVAAGK